VTYVTVVYATMVGMVLEIFVLSVLRTGPVHGYELKRRVQRPSFTLLSNNSLYPMLRRFESDGIVTKTVEAQEGKPSKNVYAITDRGRAHLTELLRNLPVSVAANEEEFLVRLSFFPELPVDSRLDVLAARTAVLDARHAQVATLVEETDDSPRREWQNLVMKRVLEVTDNERRWIATLAKKAEL
jgi:DNA-binding PadR family transcriptional regulator